MDNSDNNYRLILIKLIALQIIEGKSIEESAWILKRAGMSNKDIADVLDISGKAVGAHHSNMRRKISKKKAK